jgi:hypothetical protein
MSVPNSISWERKAHTEWKRGTLAVDSFPRNVSYINNLRLDPALQPKQYEIEGTHAESRILFVDVNILDSTGCMPYEGDVLIEGISPATANFAAEMQHFME